MNETAEQAKPAVVVCDANVLYSIVMTDLIISLHPDGLAIFGILR